MTTAKIAPPPSTVGKTGQARSLDGGPPMKFEVLDEVRQPYGEEFVFLIQKLKFSDGSIEIRHAYYVVGKLPKAKGRWVWGQFAPIMPEREYQQLIDKARSKGWA